MAKHTPLHPCTPFSAAEHRFYSFHVGDGVFDWCGDISIVQYCLRKCVTLESVLVADVKQDFLDFISILIPDFARFIWRSVERDLDLNAACSAEDVHSLIRH